MSDYSNVFSIDSHMSETYNLSLPMVVATKNLWGDMMGVMPEHIKERIRPDMLVMMTAAVLASEIIFFIDGKSSTRDRMKNLLNGLIDEILIHMDDGAK